MSKTRGILNHTSLQDIYKYQYPTAPGPTPCLKPVIWEKGDYVVVAGPFPDNFERSLAYKDLQQAIRCDPADPMFGVFPRAATSEGKRYAKTLKRLIQPTHNEWGEIAP
jgi:hypothetical protein